MFLLIAFICFGATTAVPLDQIVHNIRPGGGRIINGSPASPGQFPYQAGLFLNTTQGQSFCGGTIISADYILTAAHCSVAVGQDPDAFTVYAGIINLVNADTSVPYQVSDVVVHNDFNFFTLANDISILKLSSPIEFNDLVQPITLSETFLEAGYSVRVSGWGKTSDDTEEISPILNYVDLQTISDSECAQRYGFDFSEGVVCADTGTPIKNTCNGDSGGPLITDVSGTPVHVGIVSFGSTYGCETSYPSGYTRIAYYRDWIRENSGV